MDLCFKNIPHCWRGLDSGVGLRGQAAVLGWGLAPSFSEKVAQPGVVAMRMELLGQSQEPSHQGTWPGYQDRLS